MALPHEIDHEQRRMITRISGPILYKDLMDHMNAEVRDQGQPYAELIDARGATAMFSSDEVRDFIEVIKRLACESRLGPTAVVVSDELTFGMFRNDGSSY